MPRAYRLLRENSQRSRVSCARFQVWIWWRAIKDAPRNAWMEWRIRRAVRQHPERAAAMLKKIEEMQKSWQEKAAGTNENENEGPA